MHASLPSFVLGFHGSDASVAEAIFSGKASHLNQSQNRYDWLGSGVYFWENSPVRALEYAELRSRVPSRKNVRIKKPAVVGAVIDLGHCLNLLDSSAFPEVCKAFELIERCARSRDQPLPQNRPLHDSSDLLLRDLDCHVINTVHLIRNDLAITPYDSVRAAFIEGQPLYEGAMFRDKNHIQICIRTLSCIKGYFRPMAQP